MDFAGNIVQEILSETNLYISKYKEMKKWKKKFFKFIYRYIYIPRFENIVDQYDNIDFVTYDNLSGYFDFVASEYGGHYKHITKLQNMNKEAYIRCHIRNDACTLRIIGVIKLNTLNVERKFIEQLFFQKEGETVGKAVRKGDYFVPIPANSDLDILKVSGNESLTSENILVATCNQYLKDDITSTLEFLVKRLERVVNGKL